MEKLTQNEIQIALNVLYKLENLSRKKMTFEKAENYCNQIQKIECDIRHYNEIIEEV